MESFSYEFNNLSIYYHNKKREELKEIKTNSQKEGYVSQMLRNDTDEFTKDIYAQFAEKVNFWADRFVIDSDPNGSDKW